MTPQELLANVPLFESLTDDDVDALASRLDTVDRDAGMGDQAPGALSAAPDPASAGEPLQRADASDPE